MSERIDWTSDESVVRAAVPDADVYVHVATNGSYSIGSEALGRKTIGAAAWSKAEAWEEARKHPSVAALDEAHRKVMEKWPDADASWGIATGWTVWFRGKYTDPYAGGSGGTEAEAWIDAATGDWLDAENSAPASKLEGPSVQGKPTPNFEEQGKALLEEYKKAWPDAQQLLVLGTCRHSNFRHAQIPNCREFKPDLPVSAPREEEGAKQLPRFKCPHGTDSLRDCPMCMAEATRKRTDKELSDLRRQWHGEWINSLIQEVYERRQAEAAAPVVEEAVGEDHGDPSTWSDENFVLRGGVEEAPRVVTWISVEETLPPEGKNVAFLVEDADVAIHGWATAGYYHSAVSGWWHGTPGDYRSCSDQRWTVTHWTHLPSTEEVIEVRTKESADGK